MKRADVERAWMMLPSVAAELAARYLFEAVDSMKPFTEVVVARPFVSCQE